MFIHFITTNSNFQNVGPHNYAAYELERSRFIGDVCIIPATNEVVLQCENIKIDKQLDDLLLALAANGLQIYNSWSLDSSEINTDNVFIKFQDHLEPHANYWLSMLHLQQIQQRTEETVDNFVARKKTESKTVWYTG